MSTKELFQDLVNHFGGQTQTAEALGTSQPTVSGWVSGKHGMSARIARKACKLTLGKFPESLLCPEVFNEAVISPPPNHN